MERLQQRSFQNLNCEVRYWYRKGTGDKWVVFFHGAGLDHAMFDAQFDIFDQTYHIIAWDARGHGLSKLEPGTRFHFSDMLSDCKKLFELHHIDKATLIGQSMGGNLAQDIAYYYPEMVEKIVLIDCTRNTGKLTAMEKGLLKSAKPIFACYPEQMLLSQCAKASANTESVRQYIYQCFKRLGKQAFVDVIMNMTVYCLHEDTDFRFKQPVLLLCGADDQLGNIRKVAGPWAKDDSKITLHRIERAGHNSNQDQPEVVNRRIADFINREL